MTDRHVTEDVDGRVNVHNLLFVYGTLKRGHGNHRLLQKSNYMGSTSSFSKHRMVSLGGFPGVIYKGGVTNIQGEVYEVNDPDVRERIDQLEGYPDFYDKARIVTKWGVADMYVLSEEFVKSHNLEDNNVETGEWT